MRLLKSDIRLQMQRIRCEFTGARAKVKASPIDCWMKIAARARAGERERPQKQELRAREPYQHVDQVVDDAIHFCAYLCAYLKLEIERWLVAHKSAR